MAKFNIVPRGGKREKTIVKLKLVVQMLQNTVLSAPKKFPPNQPAAAAPTRCFYNHHCANEASGEEEIGSGGGGGGVPADVKEGHFAVFAATEDGEVKRFVVPLSYLEYPPFMRLLKEAEEEYGFGGDGLLTVPCHPTELERLLSHRHQQENRRRASGSFMLNRITNLVDLSATYA